MAYLAALREDTGREIHLGLEPEPDCYLETTAETIAFFKDVLFTAGVQEVARILKCYRSDAEAMMRRHLGVCFDTCHVALQCEDLTESLRAYSSRASAFPRCSSAPRCARHRTPRAGRRLRPFAEPVYLHQVKGRSPSGALFSWYDLPERRWRNCRTSPTSRNCASISTCRSSSPAPGRCNPPSALTPDFFHEVRQGASSHLEIETYTFDVLPPEMHPGDVVESLYAREYNEWVLSQMARG